MSVKPGLYKVEMRLAQGVRRGVLYVADGRMLGGNSAFAFVGDTSRDGNDILVEIATIRHNDDPHFKPLFGIDIITLSLRGREVGDELHFGGGSAQLPGVDFQSVMTPISLTAPDDAAVPLAAGSIANGLYSMHIQMLDGVVGGNTGVVMLHNGLIHGGDHSFDYVGSYTAANGRWKGEWVNHEHTPPEGERHIFGGYEVGVGFSGRYADGAAEAEATALAGKRSIRFKAVLKRIAEP